jgi:hypothetical protein
MHTNPADPRVAMHVCNRGTAFGEPPQGAKPGIAIMMFDGHGEKHARSTEGFGWVFELPDLIVHAAGEMSVAGVNGLAASFRHWQGNNQFWLCAPLLADVDELTLVRAWKWWEECVDLHPPFDQGSIVLLEFMQEVRPIALSDSGHSNKLCRARWLRQVVVTRLPIHTTNAVMLCSLHLVVPAKMLLQTSET